MENDFLKARITSEHRGLYIAKSNDVDYSCKITGKHMHEASSREDFPAVGDWVLIDKLNDEQAVIQEILPRSTIIKRNHGNKNKLGKKDKTQVIATNIDEAFIVESVDRDYSLNRFERYLSITKNGGVQPAIVLNKIDLISKEELDEKITEIKKRIPDTVILSTSTTNNDGLNDLEKHIKKDKTYCFIGSSGVGKSSLVNKLLGEDIIKTKNISTHSGRGKHTTTNRQMYFLENGGIVIDSPGIREVGLSETNDDANDSFDEIISLSLECKYNNCTHTHEPGCKVLASIKSGKLDKEKHSNYLNLKKESEYYESNDVEKKKKDKQFGKFLKRSKKDLRRNNHKNY